MTLGVFTVSLPTSPPRQNPSWTPMKGLPFGAEILQCIKFNVFLLFLKEKKTYWKFCSPLYFLVHHWKDPDEALTGEGHKWAAFNIVSSCSQGSLCLYIILWWPLDHNLVYTALCFKYINLEIFSSPIGYMSLDIISF